MKPPARTFKDLLVWQKAHQFVLDVYNVTNGFPKSEHFGLTHQLRKAAVSIPANIAEGFKKRTNPDKVRFMNIAQGSLEESRYYLILADDLDYGEFSLQMEKLEEVSRLLESYSKALIKRQQ